MLKTYNKFRTFLLLCFINAFVHSSDSNENSLLGRNLVKRNDDFQTCLDNFDIHQDKIIRTQDSREMGAKYINERDVLSRDECLRLCCETENCDVFVFEEKTPGSCYLFECGTPEDFKCKFTKHKNYTSAVLATNRHLTELESQIKFTQHEHELTNLRQPPEAAQLSKLLVTTTRAPQSLEVQNTAVERPPSQQVTEKGEKCSQYQFKCHTSGECIAVYNACDGIPQCADGSDEGPELKCPTATPLTQTTGHPAKMPAEQVDYKTVDEHKKDTASSSNQQLPHRGGGEVMPANSYPGNPAPPSAPIIAPTPMPYYGREGEGMINHYPEQRPSHVYHQNQGTSQIFNHKGNGIIPQKNEWYYPHTYNQPDLPQQQMMSQYGEQSPNYYDNMGYRIPQQGPSMNAWQGPHKPHEVGGGGGGMGMGPGGGEEVSRLDRIPVVNPPQTAEDYYEEVYRGQQQQPYLPQQRPPPPGPMSQQRPFLHKNLGSKVGESPMEMSNEDMGAKHDVPKKRPPNHQPEATTIKPKDITQAPSSHRKVDKLTASAKSKDVYLLEEEMDGHITSPSGAVLSLTMGLCITGIVVIFLSCRVKVVSRRMRRGGKSPYAHDADFLVNGMYL